MMEKRRRHTSRVWRGFRSFIGLIISAFTIWLIIDAYRKWIDRSNTFHTRKIEIWGNEILSETEIMTLGGLSPKASVWDIDLCSVAEKIGSNAFVESVEIERLLPDIVRIQIMEKQPIALLNVNGQFFCVDREGLILPSKPGKLYDHPVLSGEFRGGVSLGKRAGGQLVQDGLEFLMFVLDQRPEMYSRISEVVVGRSEGLILYTSSKGIPVRIGDEYYIDKINYLEAILDKLHGDGLSLIKYIDLRFEDQVIVGMRA